MLVSFVEESKQKVLLNKLIEFCNLSAYLSVNFIFAGI